MQRSTLASLYPPQSILAHLTVTSRNPIGCGTGPEDDTQVHAHTQRKGLENTDGSWAMLLSVRLYTYIPSIYMKPPSLPRSFLSLSHTLSLSLSPSWPDVATLMTAATTQLVASPRLLCTLCTPLTTLGFTLKVVLPAKAGYETGQ